VTVDELIEALHFFPRGMQVVMPDVDESGFCDVALGSVRIERIENAGDKAGYQRPGDDSDTLRLRGEPFDALLITSKASPPRGLAGRRVRSDHRDMRR